LAALPGDLRVGLDASFLALNQASGLRTYTLNLLKALVGTGAFQELSCFYLYWRSRAPRPVLPGTRERVCRFPRRLIEKSWDLCSWPPIDCLAGRVDVFHSVHARVPPQRRGGSVLTVHDLREYRLPHFFPHLQAARPARTAMARRAHRVVVISQSTRRDAIELMGLDPARVRVVPNGLDPRFLEPHSAEALATFQKQRGLARPYVLFLSSADPRKGLGEACSAFRLATSRGLSGFDLVVAGAMPPGAGELLAAAGDMERVRVIGIVGDAEISLLLAGARSLLFASHYEGFGLPLLEAFACGTPVVACSNSSIPEVAGDAAILTPTGDAEALAEGLLRVEEDDELRRTMREKGLRRCRDFTWERAAELMVEVYREAALEGC
jgi:glycosyltransferase involved in cell wall biosynthesis